MYVIVMTTPSGLIIIRSLNFSPRGFRDIYNTSTKLHKTLMKFLKLIIKQDPILFLNVAGDVKNM